MTQQCARCIALNDYSIRADVGHPGIPRDDGIQDG